MADLVQAELTTADASSVPTGRSKPPVGRSPGQLAWRRFRRDKTGVISGCVVLFFFLVGLGAPLISLLYGKDPDTQYGLERPGLLSDTGIPMKPNGGIDGEFWLGLEPKLGRDVLMQLVYGIRTSLLIALVVVFIVTAIGVIIGITAGYLGGKADYFIGRVIDTLLAIPSTLFFLAFTPIALALFIAPGKEAPAWLRATALILVLSVFGWTRAARLLRGQVLSLREREFIDAARVSGASSRRIVLKELLPNLVTPILVVVTLDVPAMVTTEAALSYLGVGMVEPTPDWGRMIHTGGDYIQTVPTYLVFPGLALLIFVLAFNLLGDSVRDALDPKSHR
ncbi:ABC transporter permease [Actinosynnema sp. ALI-1.44]|uniref:ABC transporter permease n=1 Tax=Actinosynnema sp. ALI-1.44 TaxID=1933779 RepID=UPI00192CEF23|nr:ABC transporter permease [Actinosynnema sp. ALI-1.44]